MSALLAVAAVIVGAVLGGLLGKTNVTISAVASTDTVQVRSLCVQSTSLRLPAGQVSRVIRAAEGPGVSQTVTSCQPIRVDIDGLHTLIAERPQGGVLKLQILPAVRAPIDVGACPEGSDAGCIKTHANGKVVMWPASEIRYQGFDDGEASCGPPQPGRAAAFQLPVSGALEIGRVLKMAYSGAAGNMLYAGEIRVRSRAWLSGDRIELGTRLLEAGDVVRTHAESEPASSAVGESTCEERDARGVVWGAQADGGDGGLRVVAHREADVLEVVRAGPPVRVGTSFLQQIVAQPLVTFLWQALIAIFAATEGYLALRDWAIARADKPESQG